MRQSRPDTLWLRIVLVAFSVCILVNVAFLTLALRTSTGLIHGDAYERGLAYQTKIDARARIRDAGLTVRVEAIGCSMAVSLRGPSGEVVTPAAVSLTMVRPNDPQADFREPLAASGNRFVSSERAITRGHWLYEAAITLPDGGLGEVSGSLYFEKGC